MLSNNLIRQLMRQIGRQFFNNAKSLPSLGRRMINPSFQCRGTVPRFQLSLYRSSRRCLAAFGKDFNNAYAMPSSPGEVDFLRARDLFKASNENGAVNAPHSSSLVVKISQSWASRFDRDVYSSVKCLCAAFRASSTPKSAI